MLRDGNVYFVLESILLLPSKSARKAFDSSGIFGSKPTHVLSFLSISVPTPSLDAHRPFQMLLNLSMNLRLLDRYRQTSG